MSSSLRPDRQLVSVFDRFCDWGYCGKCGMLQPMSEDEPVLTNHGATYSSQSAMSVQVYKQDKCPGSGKEPSEEPEELAAYGPKASTTNPVHAESG